MAIKVKCTPFSLNAKIYSKTPREELEMIKFLVKCGEDIDRATETGEKPLSFKSN